MIHDWAEDGNLSCVGVGSGQPQIVANRLPAALNSAPVIAEALGEVRKHTAPAITSGARNRLSGVLWAVSGATSAAWAVMPAQKRPARGGWTRSASWCEPRGHSLDIPGRTPQHGEMERKGSDDAAVDPLAIPALFPHQESDAVAAIVLDVDGEVFELRPEEGGGTSYLWP